EVDAEIVERLPDPRQHLRAGDAVKHRRDADARELCVVLGERVGRALREVLGDLVDVRALVHLLAARLSVVDRADARGEELYLVTEVVDVVLARDAPAGGL